MNETGIKSIYASPCLQKWKRLLVLLKEIKSPEIDCLATFQDPTGTIQGILHKSLLESELAEHLSPGSVLLLENISIFKPTKVSRYLNLHLNHVICLYTEQGKKVSVQQPLGNLYHL